MPQITTNANAYAQPTQNTKITKAAPVIVFEWCPFGHSLLSRDVTAQFHYLSRGFHLWGAFPIFLTTVFFDAHRNTNREPVGAGTTVMCVCCAFRPHLDFSWTIISLRHIGAWPIVNKYVGYCFPGFSICNIKMQKMQRIQKSPACLPVLDMYYCFCFLAADLAWTHRNFLDLTVPSETDRIFWRSYHHINTAWGFARCLGRSPGAENSTDFHTADTFGQK